MALTFPTKGGGGDFKSVPSGSHIAVCQLVADLGIQPGSGMYSQPKHQIFIRFEVPAERVEYERDGKRLNGPVVIGSTFTASMHEKANLRKQLESWRGRKFTDDEAGAFDVSTILGKPCLLSVVENKKGDKTYANIQSISGLPKGFPAPLNENELIYYADEYQQKFDKLPPWIQEKIKTQMRPEPEKTIQRDNDGVPLDSYEQDAASFEATDDDIPF